MSDRAIAPVAGKEIIDVVQNKVRSMMAKKEIDFPPEYSPENALKAFWLKLQNAKDRNFKPALQVCSKQSIIDAMLWMVVMGLSVAKDQGYLIVYGNELSFQPSYFGWQNVARRVLKTTDIYAQPVYKGDEFDFIIEDGRKIVTKHIQKFENINNENIIGAYATIIYPPDANGVRKRKSEIMTIDEIYEAWKMSKARPFTDKGELRPDSVHAKFKQEMCKKTVLTRAIKTDVKSSSDSDIVAEAIQNTLEAEYEFEPDPLDNVTDKVAAIDLEPEPEPEPEKPKRTRKKKEEPEPEPEPQQEDLFDVADSVTEKQLSLIESINRFLYSKGVSEQNLYIKFIEIYGDDDPKSLTRSEADNWINQLRAYQKQVSNGEIPLGD